MGLQAVESDLRRVADVIKRNRTKYQTLGSNTVRALLRKRIHNKGLNSEGEQIGEYSKGYAQERAAGLLIEGVTYRGLQTAYVDLQVTGDLLRSITTGRRGKNVVLGIAGKEEVFKSLKLEGQYGDVWRPTREEVDEASKQVVKALNLDIVRALKPK